jgi:hypothetical protein
MIHIKTVKAKVDPAFLTALEEMAMNKRKHLDELLKLIAPDCKKSFFDENQGTIINLKKMLENKDWFLTELRSLPVTEFIYEPELLMCDPFSDTKKFQVFRVVTRDVIVDDFNMGPYSMYIPVNDFTGKVTRHFHFVPEKRPMDAWRHPHHTAERSYDVQTPTECWPNTCFGSFNSVITSMFADFDFIGLVRILYSYLSRYNAQSPLPSWKEHFRSWRNYEDHCRTLSHAIPVDVSADLVQRV